MTHQSVSGVAVDFGDFRRAISTSGSRVSHNSNKTPKLSRDNRLASSKNKKRSVPADFWLRMRLASRSHSVRMTIINAAPTPMASPIDKRLGLARSQSSLCWRWISTVSSIYSRWSCDFLPPLCRAVPAGRSLQRLFDWQVGMKQE